MKRRPKSPIWTAIYVNYRNNKCRYLEFGHKKGRLFGVRLAKLLSAKFKSQAENVDALIPSDYDTAMNDEDMEWIYLEE